MQTLMSLPRPSPHAKLLPEVSSKRRSVDTDGLTEFSELVQVPPYMEAGGSLKAMSDQEEEERNEESAQFPREIRRMDEF